MSFQITHPAGGTIDKVRELPYPHFSKFTVPLVIGRMIDITESKAQQVDFYKTLKLPFRTEFLSIAFAASEYCPKDYWNLKIGEAPHDIVICDHIYTKELPESVSMGSSFGIVYPLPKDTPITFHFKNESQSAKKVWFNIKFLREVSSQDIPLPNDY